MTIQTVISSMISSSGSSDGGGGSGDGGGGGGGLMGPVSISVTCDSRKRHDHANADITRWSNTALSTISCQSRYSEAWISNDAMFDTHANIFCLSSSCVDL